LAVGKLRDGWRERELFKFVAQNCEYKTDAGTVTATMHSSGTGK